MEDIWKEINRIGKENAPTILFGQDKFTMRMMLSNINQHRYNLIWEKDRPSGFLNARRMPLRSHEDIMIFYKKLPTYNPQFFEGKPLHGMGTAYIDSEQVNNNYGKFVKDEDSNKREGSTQKFPRSVLKYNRPHPPIHPTQKPVDLLEYLIKTYTNEGDVVLDFTIGSGSTGVACRNTGRKFIGIELDSNYYNIAKERILNNEEK